MNTATIDPHLPDTFAEPEQPLSLPTHRASREVLAALVIGVATEALFFHAGLGINFWLWNLLVIVANLMVFGRQNVSRTSWLLIAADVVISFGVVRFRSDWALVVAMPASSLILAALPLLLRTRPGLEELGKVPQRTLSTLRSVRPALAQTAHLPFAAVRNSGGTTVMAVARGVGLGLPTTWIFVALLSSDPEFGAALTEVERSLGDAFSFATWSLFTATLFAFTRALHTLPRAEPEHAASALGSEPEARTNFHWNLLRAGVSTTTWAVVLAQVVLVFGLFVAVNVRHIFGGVSVIRQTSETYAGYLHSGFAELLAATLLAVCLILFGHTLLRRGTGGKKVPGRLGISGLETVLLALTAVTLMSCWQRLAIYEDAYGATGQRLGVGFIMAGVLGVLLITGVKSVARSWTGYAGALVLLAAALTVVASQFNADEYIARTNLDRAIAHGSLDWAYLRLLTADARGALSHPYLAEHPEVLSELRQAYCAPRAGDIRAFRGIGSCSRVSL